MSAPRRRTAAYVEGTVLARRLWTLTAVVAAVDFVFGATYVYQMQRAAIPTQLIGTLIGVATLAATAVEAPSGAWADRYGARRALVAGVLLWGTGLVIFGLAGHVVVFGAALLLWTLGMSLYSGAPSALIINRLRESGQPERVPEVIRRTQVVRWTAAAVGAAGVTAFSRWISPAGLIVVSGLVLLAVAAWVRLRWDESARDAGQRTAAILWSGVRQCCHGPVADVMLLSALASGALAVLVISWQPVAVALRVPVTNFGIVMLVLAVSTAAGAWATRVVAGRPPRPVVAASIAAACACLAGAGSSPGRITAVTCYLLADFFLGAAGTLVFVQAQNVFTDGLRNTMTSLLSAVQGVAMAVCEVAFGFLWRAAGPQHAVRTSAGALLLISALWAVAGLGRARRPPTGPPAGTTRTTRSERSTPR